MNWVLHCTEKMYQDFVVTLWRFVIGYTPIPYEEIKTGTKTLAYLNGNHTSEATLDTKATTWFYAYNRNRSRWQIKSFQCRTPVPFDSTRQLFRSLFGYLSSGYLLWQCGNVRYTLSQDMYILRHVKLCSILCHRLDSKIFSSDSLSCWPHAG